MREVIALESRLRQCRNVKTLGVKPNFADYGDQEMSLIRRADIVYYPSTFYADIFDAAGIRTFPSYHTYKCVQDKIKQTALFTLLKIPHPTTRVYYGKRQRSKITDSFSFPFVGKIPRGSAMGRGVFLICDNDSLEHYLEKTDVAYIQSYLPIDRDIRVVVIGGKVVHAYWRVAPLHDFRSNLAVGAELRFGDIPETAVSLARYTAEKCRWDDVGIDLCRHRDRFYVLEANMKYGRKGFYEAGIDYIQTMETMIENGDI